MSDAVWKARIIGAALGYGSGSTRSMLDILSRDRQSSRTPAAVAEMGEPDGEFEGP